MLVIAADIMLPILESRHLTAYSIIFDMFVFLLVTLFLSFTFVPKVTMILEHSILYQLHVYFVITDGCFMERS